jgi:hypothetical protein
VVLFLARAGAILAVGAALTACTPAGEVKNQLVLAFAGCPEMSPHDVDWSAARTLDIKIRQDEFQPMVIGLARDLPYVLHIRNADSSGHTLRAPAFFRQAAVAQITVDGVSRDLDGECITGVSIPAKGAVEIRLVALLEGRYAFEDPAWYSLGLGVYDEGKGFGAIVVD